MRDSLSKHMEGELRVCQTILCNALDVAFDNESEQVVISRNDCLRVLEKLKKMKEKDCFAISVVEDVLTARLFTDYNKSY